MSHRIPALAGWRRGYAAKGGLCFRKLACGVAVLLLSMPLADAFAQRPFPVYDPFYRSETARRVFYDGVAVTGEVSYRAAGVLQNNGLPVQGGDALGLGFRFDYQLATRLDLSAYWDASGSTTGRTVLFNWVGVKYYWRVENTDYAFRLAVDPSSDGRVGFPQMDFAVLATRVITPLLSNDIALGVRHVRMGFQQVVPAEDEGPPSFLNTHALGTELHLMWSYDLIIDPASSNVFVSLMGEGGQYELFDSPLFQDPAFQRPVVEDEEGEEHSYRGGVLWIRSGFEYNRPSYQIIPFLSLPMKQWTQENWQNARMQFGFRLMLR